MLALHSCICIFSYLQTLVECLAWAQDLRLRGSRAAQSHVQHALQLSSNSGLLGTGHIRAALQSGRWAVAGPAKVLAQRKGLPSSGCPTVFLCYRHQPGDFSCSPRPVLSKHKVLRTSLPL